MKYYIIDNDEKLYLDKVQDGFIYFVDKDDKIDLALVKKVFKIDDNGKEEEISITQYLMMTDQLGEGNEWEINKWMIYIFFSILSILINCMFSFVGATFTYYTLPLFLISGFCCYQLRKINKKKVALVLFILSFLFLIIYPISELILRNMYSIHI